MAEGSTIRARGASVAMVAVLVALAAFVAGPATAGATSFSSITMFSDPGDWIGGGSQRLFHSGNAQITVGGTPGYVTVSASGGTSGDAYGFTFAAPAGETLAPGVYVRAQRAPFRTAGRPGIDISGSGRGCSQIAGSFEVKEIAVGASGAVERLWVVYEQHCEGGVPALYGEVRVAAPAAAGPASALPSTVRWPATDAGRTATAVPVTLVVPAGPVTVTRTSIGGRGGEAAPETQPIAAETGIDPGAGSQNFSVALNPAGDEGPMGSANVTSAAGEQVRVTIQLDGGGDETLRAEIREGTCESLGPATAHELSDVEGGMSETLLDASMDELRTTPYAIVVGGSDRNGQYAACGDATGG